MIVERRCDIGSRSGSAGDKHAMRQGPCRCGRIFILLPTFGPLRGASFRPDGLRRGRPLARQEQQTKVGRSIIVDSVIGDQSAEIRFSKAAARGARYPPKLTPISAIFAVSTPAASGEVHHRSYNLFPVGTERQTLPMNRAVLARAIESENVVARSMPARAPSPCSSSAEPSKPECMIKSGRFWSDSSTR